jgi:hypothetical protein
MSKWAPSNKWWAATVTAAGTVGLMFWTGNGVDTDEEKVVLIGFAVQRLVAYVARNEPDVLVVSEDKVETSGRDSRGRWTKRSAIAGEPGVTKP